MSPRANARTLVGEQLKRLLHDYIALEALDDAAQVVDGMDNHVRERAGLFAERAGELAKLAATWGREAAEEPTADANENEECGPIEKAGHLALKVRQFVLGWHPPGPVCHEGGLLLVATVAGDDVWTMNCAVVTDGR